MNDSVASTKHGSTIDQPYVGPVQGKERFSSLDIVRGVALFGILLMNIQGFGYPYGPEEFTVPGANQGPNLWAFYITAIFFEGTQRTLFSLLFGAGVIILTARAEASGAGVRVADIYYRRNIWLIVFGMVNAYLLLWDGDILYYYGIAALFLFPLRHLSPRSLLITGAAALVVLSLVYQYDTWELRGQHDDYLEAQAVVDAGGTPTDEQQEAIDTWEGIAREFSYDPERYTDAIEAHTAGYTTTFMRHLPYLTTAHGNETYRYMFLDAFGMMVIGMALLKLGILTLRRSTRFYWTMVLVGYGVGVPLSTWEILHVAREGYTALAWADVNWSYDLGRLANATGHLGLLLLFVRSGALTWLQDRLAAVGRMALTNYLAHSVIGLIIFLRPGFGLYGALERYQLYYVVAAICLFQLLVSKPWLDRYRFGPMEWVWRSLTYMKPQPMRRKRPERLTPAAV